MAITLWTLHGSPRHKVGQTKVSLDETFCLKKGFKPPRSWKNLAGDRICFPLHQFCTLQELPGLSWEILIWRGPISKRSCWEKFLEFESVLPRWSWYLDTVDPGYHTSQIPRHSDCLCPVCGTKPTILHLRCQAQLQSSREKPGNELGEGKHQRPGLGRSRNMDQPEQVTKGTWMCIVDILLGWLTDTCTNLRRS